MTTSLLLLAAFSVSMPPKVPVAISKETTYITKPLRKDGLVDYVGAANAKLAATDPKDNAAVVLLKAFGPKVLPKRGRDEYLRLLRCDAPPASGEYLEDLHWLEKRLKLKPGDGIPYKEYAQCSSAPWTAAEHPLFADWIRANEKPLQLVFEASLRKSFAVPFPASLNPPIMTPTIGSDDFERETRSAVRLLQMRAMLRFGSGDAVGAFADVDTMHQLGSLLGGATIYGNALIPGAIRGSAFGIEQKFIVSEKLPATVLRARAKIASSWPLVVDARTSFIHWERMVMLDGFIAMHVYEFPPDFAKDDKSKRPPLKLPTPSAKDLDNALRMLNQFFDRAANCYDAPTREERLERFRRLENDVAEKPNTEPSGTAGKLLEILRTNPNDFLGMNVKTQAEHFRRLTVSAATMLERMEARHRAHQRIMTLAYLLAATKKETGKYPERLNSSELGLPPDALFDPCSDQPIAYRIQDGKRWIVSAGEDSVLAVPPLVLEEGHFPRDRRGKISDDLFIILP